jgi:hypothetical protein
VPLLFAAAPQSIRSRLAELLANWQAPGKSVTVQGFLDFARKFIEEAMKLVAGLNIDGKTKKEIVLEIAGALFDRFAPMIVIALPWYLKPLAYFFREGAKEQFLGLVSLLIENLWVEKFKPV